MSMRKMSSGRVPLAIIALGLMAVMSSALLAQETTPSKVDIFGGYSWASPGKVARPPLVPGTQPSLFKLEGEHGWGAGVTYNVNRFFGLTGDFSGHYSDEANFSNVMFGPKLMYKGERITPFAEVLFGLARLSPSGFDTVNGFGFGAGGGLDLNITKRVAWRVIQADYIRQQQDDTKIGVDHLNGARLQTGLVFMLGGGAPLTPPSASCTAQPTEVLAGEPITANVTPSDFNPKHTLTYSWKSTGGQVTGKETTATIDTAGLAPGSYTVTSTVTDPKVKKNGTATCSASFTIKEPPKHPPVMASCSANPATVRSGDAATITAQASSPDNRPLTYSFSPTGGRITGTGESVQLDTAGAPAGPITVTCTATDDRGLSATGNTTVNVEVPPPPPQASKLNEIAFPDRRRPARVDNTAKAILDDVALRLQREPDAKAVIVGYMDPTEEKTARRLRIKDLAAQRAVNTKEYLVKDKGIDPTRIEVRTGTAGGQRAEIYIVPAGATFNLENTTPVPEK